MPVPRPQSADLREQVVSLPDADTDDIDSTRRDNDTE